jgi:hypothetical protein
MYAGDQLEKQDAVGVGWITDTTFKINKKRLGLIMDIKQNTLNVNLKDLKFHQVQQSSDGWTIWERPGFTRHSTCDDLLEIPAGPATEKSTPFSIPDEMQLAKLTMLRGMTFGWTDVALAQTFKRFTISIWEELVQTSSAKYIANAAEFLAAAAERFRVSRQKLDNALSILRVIFVIPDPTQLTLLDFAKFMAKFGPEETLMQKIDSLLKSSNNNENWLKISEGPPQIVASGPIYGYFDENEHNCFIIRRLGELDDRIYNILNAPATDDYLIDGTGFRYSSWQHYFHLKPVMGQPALPTLQFDY